MQVCTRPPIGPQLLDVDVIILRGAGPHREPPPGPHRIIPGLGRGLLDLDAPLAELAPHLPTDPGDLGLPVGRVLPGHPQRPGELVAECGLVQEPGRPCVAVQEPAIQRPPHVVLTQRGVRDQDVGVELRVTGPARAMPKRRPDHPATLDRFDPVVTAPRPDRLPLQIPDRLIDRRLVRSHDRPRRVRAAQRPQQRHRLRSRQRQIKRAQPRIAPTQTNTGGRTLPRQHRPERVVLDITGKTESRGAGAEPTARHLARLQVVILDAMRDTGQVVALLPGAQLPDRHHHYG